MSKEIEDLEFQPFELEEELSIDTSLFKNLVDKEVLTEEESTSIADSYEAAVRASVKKLITESVVPHYEEQMETLLNETKNDMAEDVTNYLDYVVEEFVTENKDKLQAVETSKQDRALVEGIVSLLGEHYVEVPEGRQDIVESLSTELSEANEELSEAEDQIIELRSKLNGMACEREFDKIAADLSESKKERLMALVEDLSINNPEEFARKAKSYKENLLEGAESKKTEKKDKIEEELTEEIDESEITSTGLDWMDEALAATKRSRGVRK